MKYASIDIETTGLDVNYDHILSVAIIVVDTEAHNYKTKLEDFNSLHLAIRPKDLRIGSGDLFALDMNKDLISVLAGSSNPNNYMEVVSEEEACSKMKKFFDLHFPRNESITVAGKNVASFDVPFLKNTFPEITGRFRHRVLDVGSLLFDPSHHSYIPSLDSCWNYLLSIHGNTEVADYFKENMHLIEVTHDALQDSYSVALLERAYNAINKKNKNNL